MEQKPTEPGVCWERKDPDRLEIEPPKEGKKGASGR